MASVLKVNEIQHSGGTTALTIDSSGRISQPAKPAFRAYAQSAWSLPHNTFVKFPGNLEVFDIGGNYDTSTYTFTAPMDGVYYFYGQFFCSVGANRALGALYLNGGQVTGNQGAQQLDLGSTANGGISYPVQGLMSLSATDYVEFYTYQEQGTTATANQSSHLSFWFGYMVS